VRGGFPHDFKTSYQTASNFNEAIGIVRDYAKNYGSLTISGASPVHLQHHKNSIETVNTTIIQ
jgi:hypothetical protein